MHIYLRANRGAVRPKQNARDGLISRLFYSYVAVRIFNRDVIVRHLIGEAYEVGVDALPWIRIALKLYLIAHGFHHIGHRVEGVHRKLEPHYSAWPHRLVIEQEKVMIV